MKQQLSEPADGVRAFDVGPDLFRQYAEWRPTVGKIVARDYIKGRTANGLLVFYTNKDPSTS